VRRPVDRTDPLIRHYLRGVDVKGLWIALLAVTALLNACGGGNSGPSAQSAPSALSYPTPPAFVVAQAITALTPSVTGTVASYSISPALPSGLNLNTSTGVISGTPTAASAKANYTVTAANPSGQTTASVSIVVTVAPRIGYLSSYYAFTSGVSGHTDTPTSGGASGVTWSVTPALPTGLALSSSDGSISGTPLAAVAAATFVVTATSAGAATTASLTLAVNSPLVDLGHAAPVEFMRLVNADLLSQDQSGHWALWNFATDTNLASGNSPFFANGAYRPLPVNLAGAVAVIQTSTGLEIRAASDGHVLAEIPTTISWWQVASDGSYVCAGNQTSLSAWSSTGQVLFSKAGDYSNAVTFAAAAQLQVGLGAAGASVIETISVPGGTSALSPVFQGTFQSWFLDGSSFFSALNGTVWVYSSLAVQRELIALATTSGPTGQGNWFWTLNDNGVFNLYAVGNNTQPAVSENLGDAALAVPSGSTIGLIPYALGQVSVLDLSGATPVETTFSTPLSQLSAYAAISSSVWAVGNVDGVLLDGSGLPAQSRYLDFGIAWSFAGSASNVAIATGSGRILYFDTASGALQTTIDFWSSAVSLSADGTVLAAAADSRDFQYRTDRTINIYSMPTATVLSSYPYSYSSNSYPTYVALSGSGTVLGELFLANISAPAPCDAQAIMAISGASVWCDTVGNVTQIELSPDGTLVAAATGIESSSSVTNIYKNGTLATAVMGWPTAWLDNSRLLVDFSAAEGMAGDVFDGAIIYDAAGTKLASLPMLPETLGAQIVSPTSVYLPSSNTIYAETGGTLLWSSTSGPRTALSGDEGTGVVSGSRVVYPVGSVVVAEPYVAPP
jgi:hypothetical protein